MCGPVVLWSCAPGSFESWSCVLVVFWSSDVLTFWEKLSPHDPVSYAGRHNEWNEGGSYRRDLFTYSGRLESFQGRDSEVKKIPALLYEEKRDGVGRGRGRVEAEADLFRNVERLGQTGFKDLGVAHWTHYWTPWTVRSNTTYCTLRTRRSVHYPGARGSPSAGKLELREYFVLSRWNILVEMTSRCRQRVNCHQPGNERRASRGGSHQ